MSSASLASVPNIGETAPDFELPDPDMKMHRLSDYRGKKTILAFFPAAESPVCTAEMCALRDSIDQLRDLGANVIGISVDGPYANKFFVQNRHLNFPVLSDYRRDVINRYGIVEKFESRWTEPGNIVTNGPFLLSSWKHEDSIELRAN